MAEIRRPLIVDAGRRRLLAASEVLPGASIDQIAGLAPTLDIDFERQVYRHYSPATGLREKPLSDIVTFTRASSAQYWDAKGVMQLAGNNVPRIDFDPVTGACKGLLIEEARTNLLLYSEDLTQTAWTKNTSTITSNGAVAPDGAQTMDKVVASSGAAGSIQQNAAVTSGQTYTLSLFVKASELSVIRILLSSSGFGANIYVNFDLAAGVWSVTHANATLSALSVGNGVYRLFITAAATTTATAVFRFLLPNTPTGDGTNLGDGTSGLYIWGIQLEVGLFPTSYIKTESATATRAADVAVISGAAFSDFYRQIEFSIFTDASSITGLTASQAGTRGIYPRVFQFGDVAKTNTIIFYGSEAHVIVDDNYSAVIQIGSVSFAVGSSLSGSAWSGHGGVSSIAGSTQSGVTKLHIGNSGFGNQLNGHIARLAYWPSRLPNATLQQLTAG